MDEALFEKYIVPIDDEETWDGIYKIILSSAQKRVVFNSTSYYNYYPQEPQGIQLVLEADITTENHIELKKLYFHHTSSLVAKFKIVFKVKEFPNTYMVTKEDDSHPICVRLVHENILGKELVPGDIVEAQLSLISLYTEIFENDEKYSESIPNSSNGEKYLLGEGSLMPINLLANNLANLTEEEKKNKDHTFDNLVTFKGTITSGNTYKLHMFDIDLNHYYSADIETQWGKMPVFFTLEDIKNSGMNGFGQGNVIMGQGIITADVCIYEYNKYEKENNLIIANKNGEI